MSNHVDQHAGQTRGQPPRDAASKPSKRKHERFEMNLPVRVIPVGPRGELQLDRAVRGRTRDVSLQGLGLLVDAENLPTTDLLVGIEQDGAVQEYAALIPDHRRPDDERDALIVGGHLGGSFNRILRRDTLVPQYSAESHTYELPYPQEAVDTWVELGLCEPVLLDRVLVCPRCGGVPTVRYGCDQCGSGRMRNQRYIHHYACGHVAPVAEFAAQSTLTCPKCQTRKLVVGADFEYLDGHVCPDCGWSESEPRQIAHCLGCDHRFDFADAEPLELEGYRRCVDRFDPLDFVPAP